MQIDIGEEVRPNTAIVYIQRWIVGPRLVTLKSFKGAMVAFIITTVNESALTRRFTRLRSMLIERWF